MPSSISKKLTVLARLMSRDTATRYQAKHRMLSFFAKATGFRIYDAYTSWYNDGGFKCVWDGSPWNSNDLDARRFLIYSLLQDVKMLGGDTAECGVGTGVTSYIFLALLEGSNQEHHIFDSFEGLSEPSELDRVNGGEVFEWKKHDISYSEGLVRHNLERFPDLHMYKGWIPSRFESVEDRGFCLVHIDVDLYEPTRDAVAFFYPRMKPGGVIICDDYGFSSCPGAKKAMDEFAQSVDRKVVHLPTGQGMLLVH